MSVVLEQNEKITITESAVASMSLEELLEMFQPGAEVEIVGDQAEQPKKAFVVDNEERANWALRKITQAKKMLAEKQSLAASEKSKIDLWLTAVSKPITDTINHFEALLHAYSLSLKKLDIGFKSRKYPKGSVHLKAQQPELERDPDDLKKWVKDNKVGDEIIDGESKNKYIKKETVETFQWAEFKKDCKVVTRPVPEKHVPEELWSTETVLIHTPTGKVVDVVRVFPREDKFEVKVTD